MTTNGVGICRQAGRRADGRRAVGSATARARDWRRRIHRLPPIRAAARAEGWEYCLDDLSTGNLRNIAHLRDRPNFHLVVDSVLSPSIVNELVHKCDVVYHLAAAVGVRLIVEQPVHTLVTNVQGTHGGV